MSGSRIALGTADRPQLVTQVAQALQQGQLCVLPTETVYGLAVLPAQTQAVQRLQALKGRAAEKHYTFHIADAEQARALAQLDDPRVQRLVQRYWPGPLTLVLPAVGGSAGASCGLRMPAHEFTRAVIARTGPLWLTSVNASGSAPLVEPQAIEREFGTALRWLVDDGVSPLGTASTVARCTGPALEVLREGILSTAEVLQTAAAHVLFVCTGNTCRSPMAEVLARTAIAKKLGIAADALLARGLSFGSAGTGTMDDMPASEGSQVAVHELGLDLTAHQSRCATLQLLQREDRVYCLARSHLRAVQALHPGIGDKATLLDPNGDDIADPYGGDLADYRRARDEIQAAIDARVPEWLELLPKAARTKKAK